MFEYQGKLPVPSLTRQPDSILSRINKFIVNELYDLGLKLTLLHIAQVAWGLATQKIHELLEDISYKQQSLGTTFVPCAGTGFSRDISC